MEAFQNQVNVHLLSNQPDSAGGKAVTPSAESLKDRIHDSGSHATASHIYNGYDKADLRTSVTNSNREPAGDRYRISYVGTLWNLTDISPLVRGIRELAARKPELAAKLELVVAGRRTGEQEAVLDELENLPCQLTRKGYLSHREAIDVMRSSDELALLLSDVPESSRVVPAKTFEYLALRRNILAISPQGEMTEILATCPMAESFLPGDATGIARHLERRLTERSLTPQETNWESSRFERRHLTTQLANVLNFAAGNSVGADSRLFNPLEILGANR